MAGRLWKACPGEHSDATEGTSELCLVEDPYVWQYLQAYLLCDVTQLADILVAFVEKTMSTHHIFPWWLWGGPSLSFKAMLYYLKDSPHHPVEIPDPNMACVFAHAVRGGQSLIPKRLSQGGRKVKIIDLDANNLYGFGMSG